MTPTNWQDLMTDPLLVAYVRRSLKVLGQEYGAPQIHTPRQVIGEQRAFALGLKFQEDRARLDGKTGRSLASDLVEAVPFLWLNDLDPFIKTFALPKHVIGAEVMPHDRCWWTFEGGHPVINTETGERLGIADGFLLVRSGRYITVGVIGSDWPAATGSPDRLLNAHGAGLLTSVQFSAGQRWPDDIPVRDRPTVGEVLSRLAFLGAPFVESVVQRPNPNFHGTRRSPVSPEGVRFIRLRAAIVDEDAGRPGGTSLTEWRHRWLVRGHLRAQWYPKSKEHRLIWVSPYAKGPADKPFKTPVYAVVR